MRGTSSAVTEDGLLGRQDWRSCYFPAESCKEEGAGMQGSKNKVKYRMKACHGLLEVN